MQIKSSAIEKKLDLCDNFSDLKMIWKRLLIRWNQIIIIFLTFLKYNCLTENVS